MSLTAQKDYFAWSYILFKTLKLNFVFEIKQNGLILNTFRINYVLFEDVIRKSGCGTLFNPLKYFLTADIQVKATPCKTLREVLVINYWKSKRKKGKIDD